jgi:hypothetical protein
VGQDAQDELAPLRLMAARGEGRSQAALMLTQAALDVPALVIEGEESVAGGLAYRAFSASVAQCCDGSGR